MFGHVSSPLFGCIVDHEMSCKSIMHSELTRQKVNWCALYCWEKIQTHSTHRKSHFQTQNGPLKELLFHIVTGSSTVKGYMLAYMCTGRSRRMT